MKKYDISYIRSHFPAFSESSLEGWAFFENAGGSYACGHVIDRLTNYYKKTKVQPYYPYPASIQAGKWMDESYRRMAAFLGVKENEVHFGPSTSQNTYVMARALRPLWKNGDEIIVSCQDHEANAGNWRKLANTGIIVKEWHVNRQTGMLDVDDLIGLISPETRFLAYPHCSNVIGHINPVQEINRIAREKDIITAVDGVAYAPHGLPDIPATRADIYFFSLYKTWGPHLGLMYVEEGLAKKLDNQAHFFKEKDLRGKLMPAGPDHAQIAAVAGIIDYFEDIYDYHYSDIVEPIVKNHFLHKLFHDHETRLLTRLLDFLKSRSDIRIIGPDDPAVRAPTVSVLIENRAADEVVVELAKHKVAAGYGDFYAVRPLTEMAIDRNPGVLRMSFLHYTTMEEIDQLIHALEKILD